MFVIRLAVRRLSKRLYNTSEDDINSKLSKNLSCPMPNEMYFSELLAMQLMFPFAVCIFCIMR